MRALRQSVDSGVSPSCTMNANPRAADFLKRVFQLVLNGVAMRLTLPAGKRRTVISNG